MASDYRLDGKVAVITGAGGDIGGAAAEIMAERGAAIVGVDRNAEGLEALRARMPAGARFEAVVADVSKEDEVRAYAQRAKEVFGRIDLFFNNAGIEGSKTGAWCLIPDLSLEDWNQIIGVNMVGAFLGLKYVVPVMMETAGGGAIVNTSSINGLKGSRGQVAYVASKHAIDGMTRVVHKEWAPAIRVNSIAPAAIKGRMMTDYLEIVRANSGWNWPAPDPNAPPPKPPPGGKPLPGWCEPDEIARVAAFLLSDEATYISGQVYSVDGGMIAM